MWSTLFARAVHGSSPLAPLSAVHMVAAHTLRGSGQPSQPAHLPGGVCRHLCYCNRRADITAIYSRRLSTTQAGQWTARSREAVNSFWNHNPSLSAHELHARNSPIPAPWPLRVARLAVSCEIFSCHATPYPRAPGSNGPNCSPTSQVPSLARGWQKPRSLALLLSSFPPPRLSIQETQSISITALISPIFGGHHTSEGLVCQISIPSGIRPGPSAFSSIGKLS